jgi:hypothetical protein
MTANLTLSQDGWVQYGPCFKELAVTVVPETATRLHIKVQPANNASRFQYPESILPRYATFDVPCRQRTLIKR